MNNKRRNEKIEILEKNISGNVLRYPNKDPSANELLVKHTIWKDIQVSSCFFNRLEQEKELFEEMIDGKL
jgi:hypothetical protein